MHDPLLNTILEDRYLLTGIVGKGGMGIVYRAEDTRLGGRPCAIKLLINSNLSPEESARFDLELRIITQLHSEHTVQVLDTGQLSDGRRYIVMELLEGYPLSNLIKKRGALDPARSAALIKGVLNALAEAHGNGVIHRDLKPANIFVARSGTGDETAKVLDFGIAKEFGEAEQGLTAANMLIGTPQFMAPDQFLRKPAEPRTDLYAVGLLFYMLLAGRAPFEFADPVPENIATMPDEFRVGWMHVNRKPSPLQSHPQLWSIIERLLSKKPEERYPNALAVLEALREQTGRFPAESSDLSQGYLPRENSTTGFPIAGESLNSLKAKPLWPWISIGALSLSLALIGFFAWTHFKQKKPKPLLISSAAGLCVNFIKSQPSAARVFQGAHLKGMTPFRLKRPCYEVWQLRAEREGYKTQIFNLRSREAEKINTLKLQPLSDATPGAKLKPSQRTKGEKPGRKELDSKGRRKRKKTKVRGRKRSKLPKKSSYEPEILPF